MHVVLLPSWYPGEHDPGNGIFFREQAQALAASGAARVGVVAPLLYGLRAGFRYLLRPPTACERQFQGVTELTQPQVLAGAGSARWRCYRFLRAGDALFEKYLQRYGRPDLLHAHGALYGGVLARHLSARHRIPYVVTEHSSLFLGAALPAFQHARAGEVYAGAAAALAPSASFNRVLTVRYPRAGGWLTVPNPVYDGFFALPLARDAGNICRFLAIGSLVPGKGFDVLLSAFAEARSGGRRLRLALVGGGPLEATLRAQSTALGLDGVVTFRGQLSRDAVMAAMAETDFLVHASRQETFGLVVAEALAAGVPVLATRCGGPQDILWSGAGVLVDIDDAAALANAMVKVCDDPKQFDRTAIRAACAARYSSAVVARQLRTIYESAVQERA
ncbi:MAG: glycosyltransferase [Gammaproteobacteria bacterium]